MTYILARMIKNDDIKNFIMFVNHIFQCKIYGVHYTKITEVIFVWSIIKKKKAQILFTIPANKPFKMSALLFCTQRNS